MRRSLPFVDELELIHLASMTILEEIGIDFLHDGARSFSSKPAPPSTPARNGSASIASWSRASSARRRRNSRCTRAIRCGTSRSAAITSPSVRCERSQFRRSRSRATFRNHADYRDFIKLGQMLDAVQSGRHTVEPIDIHARSAISMRFRPADSLGQADHAYSLVAVAISTRRDGSQSRAASMRDARRDLRSSGDQLELAAAHRHAMLEGIIQMARRNQPS